MKKIFSLIITTLVLTGFIFVVTGCDKSKKVEKKDNTVEISYEFGKGTFKLTTEKLVGGWAEVFRKDWENSIYCSVSLEEAIQKKGNGEPNSNWTKQPATMIEKVAKVRALREAFVEDLGGMYEAEEMNVELPEQEIEQPIVEEPENDPFAVLDDINGGEPLPDAFQK